MLTLQDRQCAYERDSEALSCKHRCRGKAMSIQNSHCVFVALDIRNALRMHHNVICGLCGSYYLIDGRILEKTFIEHKICVLIFNTFIWKIFNSKKIEGDMIKQSILLYV